MSVTAAEILEQAGKQQGEIAELRAKLRESAKNVTGLEQELNRLRKANEANAVELVSARVGLQEAEAAVAEIKVLRVEIERLEREAEKADPLVTAVKEFARVVRGA